MDAAAAAVQCAHALSLLAAATGDPHRWADTTLVLHAAEPGELFALCESSSGGRFGSGVSGDVAHFSEPDLLFAPTALAAPGDRFAHLALWAPPASPPAALPARRLELRRLAAAYLRAGGSPAQLMADAAAFGDPWRLHARRRAAHLFVYGTEPGQEVPR